MQQPIRYYITKSGDEPTVRSVKVALGATVEERPESRAANPIAPSASTQEAVVERSGVKQMVQDVIRRRTKP